MIEKLEELRAVAFCKKMPKIANKFPNEALPKEGYEIEYFIDKRGLFVNKKGGLLKLEENFVITTDGKLRIGFRHHLLGNRKDVIAAGNIRLNKGRIVGISNLSGHYRPTVEEAIRYEEIFINLNYPMKRAFLDIFKITHDEAGYVIKRIKVKSIEIKK